MNNTSVIKKQKKYFYILKIYISGVDYRIKIKTQEL